MPTGYGLFLPGNRAAGIGLCAIVHSVRSLMQVFKTRWFSRFTRHEEISDASLLEAIARAERGLIDADLGGGLIKQRVARPGKGRSGGYRAVIAYRMGHRAVFVFGIAKSDRANFADDDLETAREIGKIWIPAPDEQIDNGVRDGQLIEVLYGKKA